MDFGAAGAGDESRGVVVAHAGAGHHGDAPPGARDEGLDRRTAFVRRTRRTRGQHARDAEAQQRIERREWIGSQVERTVARDRQRRGEAAELGHAQLVDAPVGSEDAADEAVGTRLAQRTHIAPHHVELVVVVEEVARARPHHGEDRHGHGLEHGLQQAQTRGETAFLQAAAQLESVGARRGSDPGSRHRVDGDLDQRSFGAVRHGHYGAAMRAQLLHLSGPERGRTITYESAVVTIGSSPGCTAVLEGAQVEPQHCKIEYVESECAFHLRTRAGRVFVNGVEVEEVILQDEDRIEFGIGGPMARFRIYVPQGAVCKPVRKMLADARAVGIVSGGLAATRTLARDLFTHATLPLKIGFPLAVVAGAFLAGWAGGWLGSRQIEAERRRTVDSVTTAELMQLREKLRLNEEALTRLARANATVRRIQQEWSRGVCLMHGVFRLRLQDQSWLTAAPDEPFEVEYTGSGFLVSAVGHVVTNRHVVAPWVEMEALAPLIAGGAVPEFVHLTATFPGHSPIDVPQAGIIRRSDDLDVAVVLLDTAAVAGLPVLPLRAGPPDGEDQRAIVVGYPLGLGALLARADNTFVEGLRKQQASMTEAILQLAATGQITPILTQGVVSNVQERMLVYDASTTHGGSGGPVFDGNGEVIAVNYAILPDFFGANFGVPIRFARELLPQ